MWARWGVLKIIEEIFKISPSKEEWSIAQFYNAAKFGKDEYNPKTINVILKLTEGSNWDAHLLYHVINIRIQNFSDQNYLIDDTL